MQLQHMSVGSGLRERASKGSATIGDGDAGHHEDHADVGSCQIRQTAVVDGRTRAELLFVEESAHQEGADERHNVSERTDEGEVCLE